MMSNCSLAKLPKLFKLPVEKKVGDLDYDKIRNSKTELTEKELGYCEYDCLVLYHYIKYELQTYENVKDIVRDVDFDMLVLGPDQKHEGFVAAIDYCNENNKTVVVLPRTEGISSSDLKALIKEM